MVDVNAVDAIIDGQTPLTYDAHRLVAWKYTLETGHPPSIDELRTYLLSGRGTFLSSWKMMREEWEHGRHESR